MNPLEYRFFKVTGDPIAAIYAELMERREAQRAARRAFAAEFGATDDMYANEREVAALFFESTPPPAGWRPLKGFAGGYLPPAGKAGKEIRKRMAELKLDGMQWFSHRIYAGIGFMGGGDAKHGIRIRYAGPEMLGDTLILLIPAGKGCNDGLKYKAPANCTEIKASEYLALKEAAELKEAA